MPLKVYENVYEDVLLSVWKIEDDVDFFLKEVSLTAAEKKVFSGFKNTSRQLQWLSCRLMVQRYMQYFGLKGSIAYNNDGCPYLTDGQHISISHTVEFSAVLISRTRAVGVDIENASERILRVRDRFVSEKELSHVHKEDINALTIIWAAKEALYKLCMVKGISFKEGIYVDLSLGHDCFYAEVSYNSVIQKYFLKARKIEGHFLVYVIDK